MHGCQLLEQRSRFVLHDGNQVKSGEIGKNPLLWNTDSVVSRSSEASMSQILPVPYVIAYMQYKVGILVEKREMTMMIDACAASAACFEPTRPWFDVVSYIRVDTRHMRIR